MMVARSHFGSNLESKVFTMSPEEENNRRKLRRVDSPDISTAFPGLALSFSEPASSVFAFTAVKNEQSHLNPGGQARMSRGRCRVCNRPKLTKASSTNRKMWHLSADGNTGQVTPFSTSSVNFNQSGPSWFFANSCANDKLTDGVRPQYIPAAGESKVIACPNLFTTLMPPDKQNLQVKKLEEADQIVQKASEMVKLLESHIASLQLSAQAVKTPSERMIPVQRPSMNPVNTFKQTDHNFMETSMSPEHLANSCSKCSPQLPNFIPNITFPSQTPSPTPSLSYTPGQNQIPSITFPCQTPSPTQNLSYSPSQPQSPVIAGPCHTPSPSLSQSYTPSQLQSPAITRQYHTQGPSPSFSYTPSQPQIPVPNQILEPNPMQRVSSEHGQKTNTPSLNVKNIVQRLESLKVSPSHFHKTPIRDPKYIHEFRFPPLRSQSKLDKDNIYRTPKKAGSVVSSSSGVNKHFKFKSSNSPGKTSISALTRKARVPTSKLIRPRQRHSSDYEDDSGSSVSSSSWTTTQQSGSTSESAAEETDGYNYSSSASHRSKSESPTTPESEYLTETTTSSASPINRPRLSISIPHSFTRRRSKRKPSVPNEKPISRLRTIKNKLGLIFHHHHHHHHHHHDEEPKPSRKKQVVRQPHEATAVKRRGQQGHFRALLGGLMRHVRSSDKKKTSKPLKEIRRLKKNVQLGNAGKRRRGLKLPNIKKKSKFKAVRK